MFISQARGCEGRLWEMIPTVHKLNLNEQDRLFSLTEPPPRPYNLFTGSECYVNKSWGSNGVRVLWVTQCNLFFLATSWKRIAFCSPLHLYDTISFDIRLHSTADNKILWEKKNQFFFKKKQPFFTHEQLKSAGVCFWLAKKVKCASHMQFLGSPRNITCSALAPFALKWTEPTWLFLKFTFGILTEEQCHTDSKGWPKVCFWLSTWSAIWVSQWAGQGWWRSSADHI